MASSWTTTTIVCALVKNTDNTNRIVAGAHKPIVHYKALGYFE